MFLALRKEHLNPKRLTVDFNQHYTIVNYTEPTLTPTIPGSNEIVWNLTDPVVNEVQVNFLPFHTTNTNYFSWLELVYVSGISINAQINELYPQNSVGSITDSIELSIPTSRNNQIFNPDEPVAIPLPLSYENDTISRVEDPQGNLELSSTWSGSKS